MELWTDFHISFLSNIQRKCPIFSVYLSCRCSWVISPGISDRGSEPQVLVIVIVPSLSWWIMGRWGEIWAVILSPVPHTTTHVWQTASTAHWDVHCLCRNWSRGHVWCDDDGTSGLLSVNNIYHNEYVGCHKYFEVKMFPIDFNNQIITLDECPTPTFWSVVSTKLVYSVPSPHGKVCQCQYSVYTNYTNFQSREWFFTLTRHRLLQQQFIGRYQKPVEVTHVCIMNN